MYRERWPYKNLKQYIMQQMLGINNWNQIAQSQQFIVCSHEI